MGECSCECSERKFGCCAERRDFGARGEFGGFGSDVSCSDEGVEEKVGIFCFVAVGAEIDVSYPTFCAVRLTELDSRKGDNGDIRIENVFSMLAPKPL